MKKKIYTFILMLFAVLLLLYFVWNWAAIIQKEAFKQHLSDKWSLNLKEENITTDGFPFKFGIKVSDFHSLIKNTPLALKFSKLEIVRLIYNFSDIIIFVEKPMIKNIDYPQFNSSSNKLKASISHGPFSGKFKLITEQEDWQISYDRNFKIFEAKKVIFALKDADGMDLDFFFQANNLGFSFLDKIQEKYPKKSNELIFRGSIFDNFISNKKASHRTIDLEFIMLEQLELKNGLFKLSCNDEVAINLLELTTDSDVDCLLSLSSKEISKIKTDNESVQSILDLINLILMIKNPKKTDELQAIPIKLSLKKGSFYINAIPIYRFPTLY